MLEAARNFLVVSDVHLGSDLVQHVRPMTVARLLQSPAVDKHLVAMLDYYRGQSKDGTPWRLIFAGDLVDFVGMNVSASQADQDSLETKLNDDEHAHGLGSAGDHAVLKMRAVVQRHGAVFDALARWLADGHSLSVVRGNHDLDFYWEVAQAEFVSALTTRVAAFSPTPESEIAARVEFHPWFYYVEGVLYVEHGHQYDAMCSYEHQLAPRSPLDPRRLSWSLSDRLLRKVSRPMPGLSSEGHDDRSFLDYLRLAFSLGLRGALALGRRYLSVIGEGLYVSWSYLTEKTRVIREEQERRMGELATHTRITLEKIQALSALAPPSVTRNPFGILRGLMFDRIILTTMVAALFIVAAISSWSYLWRLGLPIGGLALGGGAFYWSLRSRVINPSDALRHAAGAIAKIMPAKFVVMGHTHEPRVQPVNAETTYVNIGNWAIDDLDGPAHHEPPRTHMVIRWIDGTSKGEFCRWDENTGGPVSQSLEQTHLPLQ